MVANQRIAYILLALITPFVSWIVAIRLIWYAIINVEQARIIALSWDDLANSATNGYFRVTISLRAAQAQAQNKRWGCIMCKFLDILLEKDHCAKALAAHV